MPDGPLFYLAENSINGKDRFSFSTKALEFKTLYRQPVEASPASVRQRKTGAGKGQVI
jgi:hypothetical protein